MALYRRKPNLVEAEQWFPGRPDVPGVCFNAACNAAPLGHVHTAHGQTVNLAPGDFVVPEPDHRGYYPVKPDIFLASHDPAGACGEVVKGERCALPAGHEGGHKWGSGD